MRIFSGSRDGPGVPTVAEGRGKRDACPLLSPLSVFVFPPDCSRARSTLSSLLLLLSGVLLETFSLCDSLPVTSPSFFTPGTVSLSSSVLPTFSLPTLVGFCHYSLHREGGKRGPGPLSLLSSRLPLTKPEESVLRVSYGVYQITRPVEVGGPDRMSSTGPRSSHSSLNTREKVSSEFDTQVKVPHCRCLFVGSQSERVPVQPLSGFPSTSFSLVEVREYLVSDRQFPWNEVPVDPWGV